MDLPEGVRSWIWDILIEDDPQALLALEACSKTTRQQLQGKALECRLTISHQKQWEERVDLDDFMDRIDAAVQQAGDVARSEFQSVCKAVISSQRAVRLQQDLRKGFLEHYSHTVDPQELARIRQAEDEDRASTSMAFRGAKETLRDMRDAFMLESMVFGH